MPRKTKKSGQGPDDSEKSQDKEIEPISQVEALRRLREFLRQLDTLLGDLAEYPGTVVPGRHHATMRAAWSDVQPLVRASIEALTMPAASDIVPKLEDFGLMGHQPVFKLSIFQHAHDELLDHGALKEVESNNLSWWNRLRDLVKPTLKAANVILGSFAEVVPVVEPIKEYKESVESSVELGQAATRVT